jgi:thymidylate synthase
MRNNFESIYLELVKELRNSNIVGNTKEIINYQFTIDPKFNIAPSRHASQKYMIAELIWYFAGKNDMRFIKQFASIWQTLSDDGKTNNSAYGYIMQYKHKHNQIEQVIDILKNDTQSRRAVININIPHPNKKLTKDEPCTIALQYMIRNNQLYATTLMRSNDLWFGLPYDVYFFTELQKYIAKQLNIQIGTYTHFAGSMHMYLKDYDKIIENIEKGPKQYQYLINVNMLIEKSNFLYHIVNKDNIIDICLREGVLYENSDT